MPDKFSLRAVMKTDVKDFTKKFNEMSEQEISTIMSEHRQFVLNKAYRFTGKIIKGEGDAFWITFDNVTNAVSCAKEIQLELYDKYVGKQDDEVIELRIVITINEITTKEGDIFGDAVNLASRIESITPEKEIYISQSANLLLNKTKFSTTNVGKHNFKGQKDEIEVYKVNFKYHTKIIDGFIMFADMRNFVKLMGIDKHMDDDTISNVEKVIDNWFDVFNQSANQHNGKILAVIGDAFIFTFNDTVNIYNFIQQVDLLWSNCLSDKNNTENHFGIGVGWGRLYKYKQMAFSRTVNFTARIEALSKRLQKNYNIKGNAIICSNFVVNLFKEKNLYDKSKFIEVSDLSVKDKLTHEKALEIIKKDIKDNFDEDFNNFLPLHIFIPNPQPKK